MVETGVGEEGETGVVELLSEETGKSKRKKKNEERKDRSAFEASSEEGGRWDLEERTLRSSTRREGYSVPSAPQVFPVPSSSKFDDSIVRRDGSRLDLDSGSRSWGRRSRKKSRDVDDGRGGF